MPRMKILTTKEKNAFDKPPKFTGEERKYFFDLPIKLISTAFNIKDEQHRLVFLIMCGYFKSSRKFFAIKDFCNNDITYISRKFCSTTINSIDISSLSDSNIHRYKSDILKVFQYKKFDLGAKQIVQKEIAFVLRHQLNTKKIFFHCVKCLLSNNIHLPNSAQITKYISIQINNHSKYHSKIVNDNLSLTAKKLLDELIVKDGDSTNNNNLKYYRYKLTSLKTISQKTRPSDIQDRSEDLAYTKNIYNEIKHILPKLKLSEDGIKHYAYSVCRSNIFEFNKRANSDKYLHMISFITDQYHSLQDNLATALLSIMQTNDSAVNREYRDWCYDNRKQTKNLVKSILSDLDDGLSALQKIEVIIKNDQLNEVAKIKAIEKVLETKSLYKKLSDTKQSLSSSYSDLENSDYLHTVWNDRSAKIYNRIWPIVKVIDFTSINANCNIVKAINYLKNNDGKVDDSAPEEFLLDEERSSTYKDGKFNANLYKTFLFIKVAHGLKTGILNIEDSTQYKSIDQYLIPKDEWNNNKDQLIHEADLDDVKEIDPLLKKLDNKLNAQYEAVNLSITNNTNSYLKVKEDGKYHVLTPKQEVKDDLPYMSLFPKNKFIPLSEVLSSVNSWCGYLGKFVHWQQRYSKNIADNKMLLAGIISKGCAIGTGKMAKISSNQIKEGKLNNVVNWFFSQGNLQEANDSVADFISKLDLSKIYLNSDPKIHTSSDGQKFVVRKDSLNANYSYKYFGQEQGISVYSFIDQRNILWHSTVFSAADRESMYVIDGLMHNDVVKSDIHSTDTHGYSEAIFATSYLLGFSYAPRIKNLKKQLLYIFKGDGKLNRDGWSITPDKYVSEDNIKKMWDDILRFICTIKLRYFKASDIFRRLNSYSEESELYKGLKAFGQVIKSMFILDYISDVKLRQSIEKQLNKVELSNRFTRAIAVGDPRGYNYGDKYEQEIAESCNRLIKNCIIAWNYVYLTNKLNSLKADGEKYDALIEYIKIHSVVSWGHFNMLGEYDFSDDKLRDSMGLKLYRNIAV